MIQTLPALLILSPCFYAFQQLWEPAKLPLTSEPLHLLFPLPVIHFPWQSVNLALSSPSDPALMPSPQRGLS